MNTTSMGVISLLAFLCFAAAGSAPQGLRTAGVGVDADGYVSELNVAGDDDESREAVIGVDADGHVSELNAVDDDGTLDLQDADEEAAALALAAVPADWNATTVEMDEKYGTADSSFAQTGPRPFTASPRSLSSKFCVGPTCGRTRPWHRESNLRNCIKWGFYWGGRHISVFKMPHRATDQAASWCQLRCAENPRCMHFFMDTYQCYLMPFIARATPHVFAFSGPPECPKWCHSTGIKYSPTFGRSVQRSSNACQEACSKHSGCHYFIYFHTGVCTFGRQDAKPSSVKDARWISGPKECQAAEECSKGDILNPPENKRSYSTILYGVRPGAYHSRSMLHSKSTWQPKRSLQGEWMQMDLGSTQTLYGLATQGRNSKTESKDMRRWTTRYEVEVSVDGIVFQRVDDIIRANEDADTVVVAAFPHSVRARYVKIIPTWWHHTIAMRAAAVLCKDEVKEASKLESHWVNREKGRLKAEEQRTEQEKKFELSSQKLGKELISEDLKDIKLESGRLLSEMARDKEEKARQIRSSGMLKADTEAINKLGADMSSLIKDEQGRVAAEKKTYADVLGGERSAKTIEGKARQMEKLRQIADAKESAAAKRSISAEETALSKFKGLEKQEQKAEAGHQRIEKALDANHRKLMVEMRVEEGKLQGADAAARRGDANRHTIEVQSRTELKAADQNFRKVVGMTAETARQKNEVARALRAKNELNRAKAAEAVLTKMTDAAATDEAKRQTAEKTRQEALVNATKQAEEALKALQREESKDSKLEAARLKAAAERLKATKRKATSANRWEGEMEASFNDRRAWELQRRTKEVERQVTEADRKSQEFDRERTYRELLAAHRRLNAGIPTPPPGR